MSQDEFIYMVQMSNKKQEAISPFRPSLPQSSISQPAADPKQKLSNNLPMIEARRSNVKMYEQG